MAAMGFLVTERPWRQTPDALAGGELPGDWPLAEEATGFRVEAKVCDTLYESTDGEFVAEEGAGAPGAHRCCAFDPEPLTWGTAGPAPASFRRCSRAAHDTVRGGAEPSLCGGQLGTLQNWGKLGTLLEQVFQQRSLEACIVFEYWMVRLLLGALSWLRRAALRWRPGAGPGAAAEPAHATSPALAWHPHRDLLASLSESGVLALHLMGDAFAGSSTQYLHFDAGLGLGVPTCLAWQPNNLRGALAVGLSRGVAVWRCSRDTGWWRAWLMLGEAFACPAVAWAPDGRCLAAAGPHGAVRVWPHGSLQGDQSATWCVTLRRWRGGPVTSVKWRPDGTLLAVAHAGRQGFVRLWNTRSWEIAMHIEAAPACAVSGLPSLAWCADGALLGVAAGRLFELCGVGAGGGGWASGFEPTCRTLQVPAVHAPGVPGAEGGHQQAVLEVAVCQRTAKRIAVRVEHAAHVLVFERVGDEGWVKQELALRGLIGASAAAQAAITEEDDEEEEQRHSGGGGTPAATGPTPRPRALAFAGHGQWGASYEGSLLAIYWDFGGRCGEVRTYPMHYSPGKAPQKTPQFG